MKRLVPSSVGLGRMLSDARKSQSLSQAELATRAGLTQATISKIERGVSQATVDTLFRILAVLKLDLALIDRDPRSLGTPWDDGS